MKNILITLLIAMVFLSGCNKSPEAQVLIDKETAETALLAQIAAERETISITVDGYVANHIVRLKDADAIKHALIREADDRRAYASLTANAAVIPQVPVIRAPVTNTPQAGSDELSFTDKAGKELVEWYDGSMSTIKDWTTSVDPSAIVAQETYEAMVRAKVIYKFRNPDATKEQLTRVFPEPHADLADVQAKLFSDLK